MAVAPVHLVDGENLLAVEIHQIDPGSSDISFDLRFAASDTTIAVTRGPDLQMGSSTTVTVRWRTDSATDSCVRFGSAGSPLDQEVCRPQLTTEHEVTLDSLEPKTSYAYEVGSSIETLVGGDSDHFFVTSPLTGNAKATRVWVLGDSGNGRRLRSAREECLRDLR